MGASIGIVCRSKKLADKLLDVINNNIDDMVKIIAPDNDNSWHYQPGNNNWCFENKVQIGTKISDYYGQMRVLMMSIAKWGAINAGRTQKSFPDIGKFNSPVPYTRYDCFENWPVLLEKPTKELLWCYCDKYGVGDNKHYLVEEFLLTEGGDRIYNTYPIIPGKPFSEIVYKNDEEVRNYCKEKNDKIRDAIKILLPKWQAI
jgi:hypothetical protein